MIIYQYEKRHILSSHHLIIMTFPSHPSPNPSDSIPTTWHVTSRQRHRTVRMRDNTPQDTTPTARSSPTRTRTHAHHRHRYRVSTGTDDPTLWGHDVVVACDGRQVDRSIVPNMVHSEDPSQERHTYDDNERRPHDDRVRVAHIDAHPRHIRRVRRATTCPSPVNARKTEMKPRTVHTNPRVFGRTVLSENRRACTPTPESWTPSTRAHHVHGHPQRRI